MVARFHPVLIKLHWWIAVLIVAMLAVGIIVFRPPHVPEEKRLVIALHVATGLAVLGFMIWRLIVRIRTAVPPNGEPKGLHRIGRAVHYILYAVIFLTALSGLGLAAMSGLLAALISGEPLPADFDVFPPMKGHALFSTILLWLVILHVAAAGFHHFVLKDRLLSRMGIGRAPTDRGTASTMRPKPS